jgi:ketosteroid isomerase-like protein
MSAADIEAVNAFLTLMKAGDVQGASEQLAEDVVFEEMGSVPHSGTYRGREGFIGLIGQFGDLYGGFELADVSVHDAGEFIVAKMTATFVAKDSSCKAVMRVTEHYTMRDNKMAHADIYYKDPDQFKAFDHRSDSRLSMG